MPIPTVVTVVESPLPEEELDRAKINDLGLQNIDIARFEAVSEHGGSVQSLMERYGDENLTRCPYIKSMGAAGIELVQNLAAAEANPNRGPTLRDILAIRKAAQQPNPVTNLTSETTPRRERIIAKIVDTAPLTPKHPVITESTDTRQPETSAEFDLRLRQIQEELATSDSGQQAKPKPAGAEQAPPPVQVKKVLMPSPPNVNTKISDVPIRAFRDADKPKIKIDVAPKTRRLVSEQDNRTPVPNKFPDIEVPVVGTEHLTEEVMDDVTAPPPKDLRDFITVEPAQTTALPLPSEIVKEIQADNLPESKLDGRLVLPDAAYRKPILDKFTELRANISTFAQPEVVPWPDLDRQIVEKLSFIEPEQAKEALAIIKEISQLSKDIYQLRLTDNQEAAPVEQELVDLCAHLLEHLGMEHDNETVKVLIQSLLVVEIQRNVREATADIVDEGTHEQKSDNFSLLGRLTQLLKRQLLPLNLLGKLALQIYAN